MDQKNDEQRRRQALARRKEALLAAFQLLAKLRALQAKLSCARSSKSSVMTAIDRLETAIDQDIIEPEELFCELAEMIERLGRELDEEERLAAQAVMYRLAGYIEPAGQALVMGR